MATTGCDDRCDDLDFTPRIRFRAVLDDEAAEINKRRTAADAQPSAPVGERPKRLTGLALSGGGIRSATFNLGLLQALARHAKLQRFDYLSTVSGGGYCGGWWSAWLSRDDRKPGEIFPPRESTEHERDDRRSEIQAKAMREGFEAPQVNDSAINAGIDPIHHLRLFSNFLTPRTGLLSGDTWRAIAVVGRNLMLTWMSLVPLLLALIMLGQAWFAIPAMTQQGFRWRSDLGGYVFHPDPESPSTTVLEESRLPDDLTLRLYWALLFPALLYVGSVVCVVLWMVLGRRCWAFRDKVVLALSALAFFVLTWFLINVLAISIPFAFVGSLLGWLVVIGIVLLVWKRPQGEAADLDYWRNRLVYIQTATLKWSAFSAAVLLFAGFGHEVLDFLLFNQGLRNELGERLARAGGWGGVAVAVLTAVYTALKSAPTGGGDRAQKKGPRPLLDRVAFAFAPSLLLLVLGIVLAWCGHRLYTTALQDHEDVMLSIVRGALISALLFLIFALYEFRPPQKWRSLIVIVLWLAISVGEYMIPTSIVRGHLVEIGALSALGVAAGLLLRAFVTRRPYIVFFAAGFTAAALELLWHLAKFTEPAPVMADAYVPQLVIGGLLATLVLLGFELVQGRGTNTRAVALMAVGFVIFVSVGVGACSGTAGSWRVLAMLCLIATILGWVLAFGWLADPNTLTIHGFYKSRLVRAYLGASNARRGGANEADITDAVPEDDIRLVDMQNSRQGAPYHLINTTLNLVGGQDLATQQRFSDSFVMSKLYCGSLRTGYRKTSEYACGTISLGTAVAVSGAAVSPNAGAQSPSAALAALLTLFNIRLGYWAPTPDRSYWRTSSPRLWPVYSFQELLSQTTDLLPFCYLTDGGHFDNSGVYALIQRGCNTIVYADCGADPETTLEDIGNLVRKVRIDFGTEIDLETIVKAFRQQSEHFVAGTIHYSKEHAAAIGLPEEEWDGTLIIVKPNLAKPEMTSVDVLQYGYLYPDFPQQPTADQWYDEAQFESYRRLGEIAGEAVVGCEAWVK